MRAGVFAPDAEYWWHVLEQSRPAEIADYARLRHLVELLAAIAVVWVGQLVGASVLRRRRDLAILRAMGFQRADQRRVIAVLTLVVTAPVAAGAVVVGALSGRWAWHVLADHLGVDAPTAIPSLRMLAAVALLAGTVALTAAIVSRHVGADDTIRRILRAE